MNFQEYRQYDGLGLARLVAAGEVSAAELLELALARSAAVNPKLNAVVVRMDEIARARAATVLSGAFAGVPFLLKNLEQHHAGVVSAHGCRGLKEHGAKAMRHAEITQRWLRAGVVILGQTNTPELGMKPITEPLAWGPARNPWNLARSPGGSSGGSAAAVAAGIVPMAGGNDVGGSIRIPAAVCGLFGFKPGRGRTPWGPERGEVMHGAAVNHVLTRSVRDSAAMLDASQGREVAAAFHIAAPERPYLEEVGRAAGKLRIAYCMRSPSGTEVCAEAVLAVNKAARLLESLGHRVELAEPAIGWEQMLADFMRMMYANTAAQVSGIRQLTGCGNSGFEPDTLLMAGFGRAIRADEYAASLARWQEYQRVMNEFLQRHDVYMTPTVALPPPLLGQYATPAYEQKAAHMLQALGLSRMLLESARFKAKILSTMQHVPFTQLANLTGAPAMSVPLHWSADGLPLGVHFEAGPGSEGLLFRLAAQLEQAQPWFDRVPQV
ncbi:MAG: amidase family protein [Pseudomonadota bacterium]